MSDLSGPARRRRGRGRRLFSRARCRRDLVSRRPRAVLPRGVLSRVSARLPRRVPTSRVSALQGRGRVPPRRRRRRRRRRRNRRRRRAVSRNLARHRTRRGDRRRRGNERRRRLFVASALVTPRGARRRRFRRFFTSAFVAGVRPFGVRHSARRVVRRFPTRTRGERDGGESRSNLAGGGVVRRRGENLRGRVARASRQANGGRGRRQRSVGGVDDGGATVFDAGEEALAALFRDER